MDWLALSDVLRVSGVSDLNLACRIKSTSDVVDCFHRGSPFKLKIFIQTGLELSPYSPFDVRKTLEWLGKALSGISRGLPCSNSMTRSRRPENAVC